MKYLGKLLGIIFLSLPIFLIAQTQEERQQVISGYDLAKLAELEEQFAQEHQREKADAIAYAVARGIPVSFTNEEGALFELQKVKADGVLIYYRTSNTDAALSTRTNHINTGGSTGFNLDGQNMIAYVWDGGHARETHVEFDGAGGSNRVTSEDMASEGGYLIDNHATHVSGTICAAGILNNGDTKGMAPFSQVKCYKWNNDVAEATAAAANGMLISNHSYGWGASNLPDYYFGAYLNEARDWDLVHNNAPYYLMVIAAGNDGNSGYNGTPLDASAPNYDILTGHAITKNNLVVANALDASVDANGNLTAAVQLNSSSSLGPTDDLRIKPDITGNGTGLRSPLGGSDTQTASWTGTSMASPNVSGSLLLLQQHHNNLYGTFMRAATLKGLALHTADDAGMTGPDARFGWGLLNAKKAAESITNKGSTVMLEELVLNQGNSYSFTVTADGINPLQASISWNDPAGVASSALNNGNARLVNDLDIQITQNTSTFYPWRLTGVNTNANNADNTKDPYERIDIASASGTYTVTITHKGTLSGGSQNYSLIITGITNAPFVCNTPGTGSATNLTPNTAQISWLPSPSNPNNGYQYYVTAGGPPPTPATTPTGTVGFGINQAGLSGLSPTTNYTVFVRSDCGSGNFSGWVNAVTFYTPCASLPLPYFEDFEGGPLSSCWQTTAPTEVFVQNGCAGNSGSFLQIGGGEHVTLSPRINVGGTSSIDVSFDISNFCNNNSEPGEWLNVDYWNGSAWQNLEVIDPGNIPQGWTTQKTYTINSGLTADFQLRFERPVGNGSLPTFDDLNIDNLTIEGPLRLFVSCFLEGPYNAVNGNMNNALGAGGSTGILATEALSQPYNVAPWNYAGTESVSASFFDTHTDIVDWVLVELRDKLDNTIIVARRAGFVKTNGSVIATNGTEGLLFEDLAEDDYYVSIRHRNHLGVMGNATVTIDYTPLGNEIDFTTTATVLFGTNAAVEVEPGVYALHMGNANYTDGVVSFTGSGNDKAAIGITVNSTVNLTNTKAGYEFEDINLDGITSFTGSGNDKAKLGIKLGIDVTLTNIITEQLP